MDDKELERKLYQKYLDGIAEVARKSVPGYRDTVFLVALMDSALGLVEAGGHGIELASRVLEVRSRMWRVAEGKNN